MPPPRWTTDPQFEWLKARLPKWLEHRSKGTLAPWVKQVFHEWVEEYGLPDITQEELIAANNNINAAKKAKRSDMRRVSDDVLLVYAYSHIE